VVKPPESTTLMRLSPEYCIDPANMSTRPQKVAPCAPAAVDKLLAAMAAARTDLFAARSHWTNVAWRFD
jgi:hypothetical protein